MRIPELERTIVKSRGVKISDNLNEYVSDAEAIRNSLAQSLVWARKGFFNASQVHLNDALNLLSIRKKIIDWGFMPKHYEPLYELIGNEVTELYQQLRLFENKYRRRSLGAA